MSAKLIRRALDTQPCPACGRRTMFSGLIPRRARCLFCGHRAHVRLAFRRAAPAVELVAGRFRAERWNGQHRA